MVFPPGCAYSNYTWHVKEQLDYVAYYFIVPIYFFLGIGGNLMLIIAFYKQSKTEKAYGYQVILTSSKMFETFVFSTFLVTLRWWSGLENDGWLLFRRNYFMMFITVHLGPPLVLLVVINSLFLSIAMTADRVFALWKPFAYKTANHFRNQVVTVLASFAVSFLITMYDGWRFILITEDDHYKVIIDEEYLASTAAHILPYIPIGVRVSGVIALASLNVIMIVMFRKRMKTAGKMSNSEEKEQARKAADKNLLLISIYQSVLMCCNQVPHVTYHMSAYLDSSFTLCEGQLHAPISDAFIWFTDMIDLFLLLAINKKMRRMVAKVLPCIKSDDDNTTLVVNVTTSASAR